MKARFALAAVVLAALAVIPTEAFPPRRILYARCSSEKKMPRAVFMTCANRRGVCEVRIGNTHNLRAVFIPDTNATNVDSYVRWNSWFDVPLPGQDRNACDGALECPVTAGEVSRFTYSLSIQDFWPRSEYPVIWSLTDKDTREVLVCFKFRINIV